MPLHLEMKVLTEAQTVAGQRYPTVTAQVMKRTTLQMSRTNREVYAEGEIHSIVINLRREQPPRIGDIIKVDPLCFHEV